MIFLKKYSFFLLFLFCSFIALPVDDYKLIKSISFPQPVFFTTDKLGNAYVVVENQLLQFDPQGNAKGNYSRSNIGALSLVDASNPMKILLFYPDYATVVILDAKLSLQSEIDLRSLNINQPLIVCNSGENAYWVYDRQDDELKKIDNNGQVIHQSSNLTQLTGYQLQPNLMLEDNGFVFINNPATGILVFDRYGTYYKIHAFEGLKSFQVVDNDLLFVKNNHLYRYNSKSLSEKEILTPPADSIRGARIEQHELYLLTSDSLNFYYF